MFPWIENRERWQWPSSMLFFFTLLSFNLGFSNLWRYPYYAFKHGGGSFFLAYVIVMILIGVPMLFLELAICQHSGFGPSRAYGLLAPAFRSLGWAGALVTLFAVLYYNVGVAWSFYLMFESLAFTLPWSVCDNDFNTVECFDAKSDSNCASDETFWGGECASMKVLCSFYNLSEANDAKFGCFNGTANVNLTQVYTRKSAVTEYFTTSVLAITKETTWNKMGPPLPHLFLPLILSWIILATLIQTSSFQRLKHASLVISIIPYIFLIVFLVVTLWKKGPASGLGDLMDPSLSQMSDLKLWVDATSQVFLSMGSIMGVAATMSSFNRFTNNCLSEAVWIATFNCFGSFLASLVVLSLASFIAVDNEVLPQNGLPDHLGLPFIAFATAVTELPIPPIWSFIFFMFIGFIGLWTIWGVLTVLFTALSEEFLNVAKYRIVAIVSFSSIFYLVGLVSCTPGGILFLTLLDQFAFSWSLFALALILIILIAYIYTFDSFLERLSAMEILDELSTDAIYWWLTWQYVTPAALAVLTFFIWVAPPVATFEGHEYPAGVKWLGWIIAVAPVSLFMACFLVDLFRMTEKTEEGFKKCFQPREELQRREIQETEGVAEDDGRGDEAGSQYGSVDENGTSITSIGEE